MNKKLRKVEIEQKESKNIKKRSKRPTNELVIYTHGNSINQKLYVKELTDFDDFDDFYYNTQEIFDDPELKRDIENGKGHNVMGHREIHYLCGKEKNGDINLISLVGDFESHSFYSHKKILYFPEKICKTMHIYRDESNSSTIYAKGAKKKYAELNDIVKKELADIVLDNKLDNELDKEKAINSFLAKYKDKKVHELVVEGFLLDEYDKLKAKYKCKNSTKSRVQIEHILHPSSNISDDRAINLILIDWSNNGVKGKIFDTFVKNNMDKFRVASYNARLPEFEGFDKESKAPNVLYLVISYLDSGSFKLPTGEKINYKYETKRLVFRFKNLIENNFLAVNGVNYKEKMCKLAEINFNLEEIQEYFSKDENVNFFIQSYFGNTYESTEERIKAMETKITEEYEKFKLLTEPDKKYAINIQHIYDITIYNKSGKEIYSYEGMKVISREYCKRIEKRFDSKTK